MRSVLLYAGMAADKQTEQIGVAISDDGTCFRRLRDEPAIRRDPGCEWKAVRVCNPSVVPWGDGYLMLYQGVAAETFNTSIGLARSPDALRWDAEDEACLHWREVAALDPDFDERVRVGAIEPSVLVEDGLLKMWFVYSHRSSEGNALFYAESATGEAWDIRPKPVLTGREFGFRLLHYPQVLRSGDVYELFFTLRSRRTEADSIWRATSADGIEWCDARRVLSRLDPDIVSRDDVLGKLAWRVVRPVALLDRRLFHGRRALGYSHPHVASVNGRTVLYFHVNHVGPRGRALNIGRRDLGGGPMCTVFSPSADPGAWDSFFVGDPFVLELEV